jgi:hypothetical protein
MRRLRSKRAEVHALSLIHTPLFQRTFYNVAFIVHSMFISMWKRLSKQQLCQCFSTEQWQIFSGPDKFYYQRLSFLRLLGKEIPRINKVVGEKDQHPDFLKFLYSLLL